MLRGKTKFTAILTGDANGNVAYGKFQDDRIRSLITIAAVRFKNIVGLAVQAAVYRDSRLIIKLHGQWHRPAI